MDLVLGPACRRECTLLAPGCPGKLSMHLFFFFFLQLFVQNFYSLVVLRFQKMSLFQD